MASVWEEFGDPQDSRDDLLDLTLYYIRLALADHELTDEEMDTTRTLKRLFKIQEGDLANHRTEEVAELLSVQIKRVLADRAVDPDEALHKARLQEVFDLGYDQFVELTKPLIEEAIAEIVEVAAVTNGMGIGWIEERIRSLDTVYDLGRWLTRQTDERIQKIKREADEEYRGSLDLPELPTRRISQQVKDQVWRRDQGRCVECGNDELLEFDHIIPHSKGGANTYRNIQLLCEGCNRKKSDRIG